MAEVKTNGSADDGTSNDLLVDYEEEDETALAPTSSSGAKGGSYAGILEANFRDFLLKPEIMRSIGEAGFEHPSEVQQQAIPAAMNGQDLISQAKSGMGKTAVFVLATLQQIDPQDGVVDTLVLCHTRELAFQIANEFERFAKYLPNVKIGVVYGGLPFHVHKDLIQKSRPHILIGTPGRVLHLLKENVLDLGKLKRFVLDECDNMLEALDMRRQVQDVFKQTPHDKQVMMFSATIAKDTRVVCRKFTKGANEIFVDDRKLTLHGLQQYFVKLGEKDKNRKLNDLLDALDFNQVVIFVRTRQRAHQLNMLLEKCAFPSMTIHANMAQEERLKKFQKFKDYKSRILVSTNLFGRGVDVERVNIVINYDMPMNSDEYLHRVGRAGRFGTKGMAITFVSSQEDVTILEDVQKRFEVKITALPDEIDTSTYMN